MLTFWSMLLLCNRFINIIIKSFMKLNFFFSIFHSLSNMFGGTVFSILSLNAVFMAIAMFHLEHVSISINKMTILKSQNEIPFICFFSFKSIFRFETDAMAFDIVCVGFSLFWPFLYCYFATFASVRISSINMAVYSSTWYSYSLNLRKFTILIIARSQQPVYFTGFNLIRATLKSFSIVSQITTIFSIFLKSIRAILKDL